MVVVYKRVFRGIFEHWGDITAEPGQVDYIEVDAGGVEAMWAVPKNCADDRVALCTHGGGYGTGSMYTHRKMFGHIVRISLYFKKNK